MLGLIARKGLETQTEPSQGAAFGRDGLVFEGTFWGGGGLKGNLLGGVFTGYPVFALKGDKREGKTLRQCRSTSPSQLGPWMNLMGMTFFELMNKSGVFGLVAPIGLTNQAGSNRG